MDEKTINLVADRLGKLTVVGFHKNEAGPLERYVRRATLLELAEDVLATLGQPRWHADREALIAVVAELRRARKAHAAFPSLHHAYGVVTEEYKEFEREVFKRDVDRAAAAREAVQVAASAVRTLSDLGLVYTPERRCRICGCTEDNACILEDGPCSWVEEDLCNNPACLKAAGYEED